MPFPRLPWALLKFEQTRIGHHRWLRVTHMPTGCAVETDGDSVSERQLVVRLLPELSRVVADWTAMQKLRAKRRRFGDKRILAEDATPQPTRHPPGPRVTPSPDKT